MKADARKVFAALETLFEHEDDRLVVNTYSDNDGTQIWCVEYRGHECHGDDVGEVGRSNSLAGAVLDLVERKHARASRPVAKLAAALSALDGSAR